MRALLAVLGILVLLIGLPTGLLFAWPLVVPNWLGMETLRIVVLGGDVSRVLLMLAYAAAWLVWAWLAGKVLAEVVRQAQHLQRPHLTPLPAGRAGKLVATASLLFASLPLHSAVAAPTSAVATVNMPDDGPIAAPRTDRLADSTTGRPAEDRTVASKPPTASTTAEERTPSTAEPSSPPRLVRYVVRQRDSLWGLAESLLGDGRRYGEIHALNRDVLGPDPGFLPAGVTILVPETAPPSPARSDDNDAPTTRTVRPGDTLSEIALDHYGDPAKYKAIAQASKDTVQPDGQHLTDPDIILPGWTVTLLRSTDTSKQADFAAHQEAESKSSAPTADRSGSTPSESSTPNSEVSTDAGVDTDGDHRPEGGSAADKPTGPSAQSPWVRPAQPGPWADTDGPQKTRASDEHAQDASDEASAWLLPGVAAGGAILAAGLHVVLTRGRDRRARVRRPGRMTAPTPPDLIPVVATARFVGGDRAPDVQRLDLLLRSLAGPHLASGQPRPKLVAVELTKAEAILHLREPAVLPEPWTGDGTRWAAPLVSAPNETRDLVPYPMLVTVGVDDAGNPWLLDLEHLRTVAVVGEAADVTAFGRHLVAELAVNPWTVNLTTHAVGLADGAAALSRYRVEEHTDTRFVEPITAYVRQTANEIPEGEDHEWFHAVLTTDPTDDVADLATAIHAHPGRPGTVVVTFGGRPRRPDDIVLDLRDGRLRIDAPSADLDLVPALMTADELDACTRIVQLARDPVDVANPLTDVLLDTEPAVQIVERPDDPETPAGPTSILPASDVDYTTGTANTREDLAQLAPTVHARNSETGGDEVDQRDLDPTLDDDLAAWWTQDTDRPRVEVLGIVSMWGIGSQAPNPTPAVLKAIKVVTDRRPLFTVLMAFLALHPQGVTLEQVEQVTGLVGNDARSRITSLRGYLGARPDGTARIPLGKAGRPKADDPPHLYRLEDALVDADLFRRLYQRAIRLGADGLTDLVTALELVDGQPFTLPKDDPRWLWATDGEDLAAQYTALIGDAAHLVITRAVLDGDLPLARRACETWRACDPSSEALAADDRLVTLAEGHPDQAQQIAAELWTRNDDETGPTEPGERTQQILAAHHETGQQTSTSTGASSE